MTARPIITTGILALILALAGCGGGKKPASGKPLVVVSVPPQAYFVQRIAGDRIDVEVLVQANQDPHTFSPTAQQVVRVERAAVVFRVGMPFEDALIGRIAASRPDLRIVDTNQDLPSDQVLDEDEREHGHEAASAAVGHHGLDPHTWMSPRLARRQAAVIARTLAAMYPADAELFGRNLAALEVDLDALDRQIAEILQPVRGRTFYVFHPAFGYFAQAYGLVQEAVEVEGKEPSPRYLSDLIATARARQVHTIFIQPQMADRAARTVAEQIGAQVVPLSDLSADYLNNLLDVARKIRASLADSATAPAAAEPGEGASHG